MKNIFIVIISPGKKCNSNMDVTASSSAEAVVEAGRNNEVVSIIIDKCLSKIFLAMKLTVLFVLVASLQVNAHVVDAQRITYARKNVSLEKVFNAIRKQTGYEFLYNSAMLKKAKVYNPKLKDAPLKTALEEIFKDTPLTYTIIGKTIVVKEKTKKLKNANPALLFAGIHGTIVDSTTGDPLVGVTIKVEGSTIGTVTDANGEFSLNAPENAVLEVSYVGYRSKKVTLKGEDNIRISLSSAALGLNQLVVIGYGTQEKKSVTASISSIKGEEFSTTPITNLSNGLAGRASGIIARQENGRPGSDGSNIIIRGIASIGSTQPLIIVDGIPRDYTQLDPNTIASVTVLKDAAAIAPYGVAGANGVILVTTKTGKSGPPQITYNGYIGFQDPTVLPNYVNGYQFAKLQNAAANNQGLPQPYSQHDLEMFKKGTDTDGWPDPDYRDMIVKHALITNHNIQLSGGSDKVTYFGSLGYQYQGGMWPSVYSRRYNLDLRTEVQATKTTNISFQVYGRENDVHWNAISPNRIWELIGYTDTRNGPNYFSNGMPGNYLTSTILTSGYHKINTTGIYSQLSIEQTLPFIDGLKIKGTVAYDPTFVIDKLWRTPVHRASIDTTINPYKITDGIFEQTQPSLNQSLSRIHQLTYQAGINYNNAFNRSKISALVLLEIKSNHSTGLSGARQHFNLFVDELSMGSSSQSDISNGGTSSNSRQVGFVYRVTYSYANKYLFEASGRYDGNYYFAPGSRFGFFPAFSAGWRLSDEDFMKNISWLNNFKIRVSYGEAGALAGSPFQYLSTYSVYGPAYVLGGNAVQAASERAESNPEITWEKAKKFDVGFDATFWKGLDLTVDYFYGKRSNMLVAPDVTVPAAYGVGLSQVNAGVMENQGVDISGSYTYKVSNDFQVSLGGNFTYAHNKLLQVFETSATYDNPHRRRTGRPLGTRFGYHALGYFQLDDFKDNGTLKSGIATQPWGAVQPGDLRYKDVNGDGKIDVNDYVPIGYPDIPEILYGLTSSIKFKGLQLDVLFQGTGNVDLYMDQWKKWAFYNGMSAYVDNFDYWTPDNKHAAFPRITTAPTTNNSQPSSWWIQNASYLRLKSATLSYTLPSIITEKINIHRLRIYLSGQNLLTWSGMTNYDPESTGAYTNLYPQQRVITAGLNISF